MHATNWCYFMVHFSWYCLTQSLNSSESHSTLTRCSTAHNKCIEAKKCHMNVSLNVLILSIKKRTKPNQNKNIQTKPNQTSTTQKVPKPNNPKLQECICFLICVGFKENCSDNNVKNVNLHCKSESHLRKILICPIYWLANQGYWKIEHSCFCCHEWEQLEKKPQYHFITGDFHFISPMFIICILTQFLE